MQSGILVINKEKDITSRDVVNIACKKLNTRHIGHTGTLDPIATGVLVLGVNDGCKVIDLLTSVSKVYQAEVIVGIKTDTLDITGKIEKTYNIENLTKKQVEEALSKFIGKYLQEVPKYSAIHVNGKRLYEYARKEEEVTLPKREVEIFKIELLDDIKKQEDYYTFSFRVHVSKGTYIRSLIRDIGKELGYPCTMKNLIREKQGDFSLEDAISINEIAPDKIKKIEDALCNYEKIIVQDKLCKQIENGSILTLDTKSDVVLLLNPEKQLLAIYQRYPKDPSKMKPYKVFGRESSEEIK